MDNLRLSIKTIFHSNNPDVVLKGKNEIKLTKEDFLQLGYSSFKNYSLDEIQNVYQKLIQDWWKDPFDKLSETSIFHLLIHFNKKVLTERNLEPFVQYDHLLRWRELSHELGEDLFTCSYLAYMDVRSNRKRHNFSWRTALFSTNNRLKELLQQGVAENHFHLKGSAPVFDLSWMSLMNNVTDRSSEFKELEKGIKLRSRESNSFQNLQSDTDVLVYKAAYIRSLLFKYLNEDEIKIKDECLQYASNKETSFELLMGLSEIQNEISSLRVISGYKFHHRGEHAIADYAISKNMHADNFTGAQLLFGERKFLYDCFTKIYRKDCEFKRVEYLFYAYLLIKSKLREELIQVNEKVGFGNFSAYQDRKELFIPENSIYETAFLSMAVNDTQKFQQITSFEIRKAPKNSVDELSKSLSKDESLLDKNAIQEEGYVKNLTTKSKEFIYQLKSEVGKKKESLFYTIHFIKMKEKSLKKEDDLLNSILPRHHRYRKMIKKQATAIKDLRESYSKKAKRIRGIDAASSEFNARPEVFAQAFRFLKDHKLRGKYDQLKPELFEQKLYATYHAGEDFYDIVDGLRTIDEAVKFLKLDQGDRLGHALALGIHAKDYFDFKGRKLMLPKEMLLDNVVWLLAKVKEFNIDICAAEVYKLEDLFRMLFREIYQDGRKQSDYGDKYFERSFSPDEFYDAWKLRGDDPMLYLDYQEDVECTPNMTYWERCRINYFFPVKNSIRKSEIIRYLYYRYHFDPVVKRKGKEIKQFDISEGYIQLVNAVQKKMQLVIRDKNIGIECNPTSNYLIGTIDKYEKHPIKTFFNLGLETDPELLNNCPQLFVSINTDDQGIFGTSLENEYALMAIAMEKARDEQGNKKYSPSMIYQWLDNIRKMGLEQSFKA